MVVKIITKNNKIIDCSRCNIETNGYKDVKTCD